jgi:hypothetical protein
MLNIIVIDFNDSTKLAKTLNSLEKINFDGISSLTVNGHDKFRMDILEQKPYSILVNAGDIIGRRYINAFAMAIKLKDVFFQPQFTYLFERRGRCFFRKNFDIVHESEDVFALLLYPHISKHIIFRSKIAQHFQVNSSLTWSSVFPELVRIIIQQKVDIGILPNTITAEDMNSKSETIQDKESYLQKVSIIDDIMGNNSQSLLQMARIDDVYKTL